MKRIGWFVSLVCLSASMALAQNAQLSGVVKDKTGAVVPQAEVTLKNVDTAGTLQTKTSKVGFFVFPSVQPGRYDLSAAAKGFDQTVVNGIKVDTAANVSQDLVLQVRRGAETVMVVQKAELNTTDGTVSTVISHELIENMPLNGNDLTTMFELTPGTLLNASGASPSNGGGFSVDGQRPTANYVTVDGASANAYVPTNSGLNNTGAGIATSASGGTNGILPVDAIEEYRMDTSTYTAENGRTPGGQIQVRTRSGTNLFHGTLFENFRNQILDADDWFTKYDNLTQAPLRMNEFGGTLGGPILRNKLFFFIASDNLILDQPNTITNDQVPDASLISGAYPVFKTWLGVFPAGNGGRIPNIPSFDYFSGSFPDLIRDHTTSVRMDWLLPQSIHAFFRANIAPSSAVETSDGYSSINGQGSHVSVNTYTGGITTPIGENLVNELTINETRDNTQYLISIPSVGGNTPDAILNNLPNGVTGSDEFSFEPATPNYTAYSEAAIGPATRNRLHQWNMVDTFAFHHKANTFKLGVDFLSRQSILQNFSSNYQLAVQGASAPPYTDTGIDTGTLYTLDAAKEIAYPTITIRNTSLFVNDDWKTMSSLTLNAGVRWELDPSPTVGPLGAEAVVGDNLTPSTFQLALSTKPLYQTVYSNFAPRVGFAWSPYLKYGMVIRGGLGIYFDTGQAATVAGTSGGSSFPYQYTQSYSDVNYAGIDFSNLANTPPSMQEYEVYIVNPHLLSPRTYEWSLTVDQAFGRYTKLTASYVGNDGERLIGQDVYYNAKNAAGQYPINTSYVDPSGALFLTTNQSHSNYQALQAQLSTRMGQHFSALLAYTWSHAEDNGSSDFSSVGTAALNPLGNSANDIPEIFATAIHYAPTGLRGSRIMHALTNGWGLDTIARLQSATPITVTYSSSAQGNLDNFTTNADVLAGLPTVLNVHINPYSGDVVPGNKLLNWAAFTAPPTSSSGVQERNGDSPTNGYRLFGLKEWDVAASRSWKVWKNVNLVFRVDAYNLLNTANFYGGVYSGWNSGDKAYFGVANSTYASGNGGSITGDGSSGAQLAIFQNGGPRELQLSLKLKF